MQWIEGNPHLPVASVCLGSAATGFLQAPALKVDDVSPETACRWNQDAQAVSRKGCPGSEMAGCPEIQGTLVFPKDQRCKEGMFCLSEGGLTLPWSDIQEHNLHTGLLPDLSKELGACCPG